MNDKPKKLSPPYATFPSFINFLNKLRDSSVPGSVFGNASGSISYSVIASLKYLKLIDDDGLPSSKFVELVNATDEDRKALLREVIEAGYPSLFGSNINLGTISAGQFDDHIRKEFEVQGSTVDKIASFFIAAAKLAEIPISPHLASRKPVATSSSSRKSSRQRRRGSGDGNEGGGNDDETPPPMPPAVKALEYQLIDLMSEPDIDDSVKQSIWTLVQYLTAKKAKNEAGSE